MGYAPGANLYRKDELDELSVYDIFLVVGDHFQKVVVVLVVVGDYFRRSGAHNPFLRILPGHKSACGRNVRPARVPGSVAKTPKSHFLFNSPSP